MSRKPVTFFNWPEKIWFAAKSRPREAILYFLMGLGALLLVVFLLVIWGAFGPFIPWARFGLSVLCVYPLWFGFVSFWEILLEVQGGGRYWDRRETRSMIKVGVFIILVIQSAFFFVFALIFT